jgi:uncharacterized membrane protein YbhN (UPF0104 family)
MPRDWQRVAGLVFVATAFAFLFWFVARNAAELRAHQWTLRPGLLAVSLGLHIIGLLWGVFVWRLLLRQMGYPVGYRALARVWFVSGLGRYIPGKIWQFVGAAHLGAAAGLTSTVTVTSLAVHSGIFGIAAILAAAWFLPAEAAASLAPAIGPARLLAPFLLLLVHPSVIRTGLRLVRRMTGRDLGEWNGRWANGVLLVVLAMGSWIVIGAAFDFFVRSLTTPEGITVGAMIAVNALAFITGYLVFIAPAGLGAKEGALAAMLSTFLPVPVAALVAIATRLWTVAAEIVPALLLLPRPASESRDPAATPDPEKRFP